MADTDRVRLFVAIALPEEIKDKITAAQAELRAALQNGGVRWARSEQFHLTLSFLGDVEAERVEALGEALRHACHGFAPLRLSAAGVGCFPDLRRPRVIWAGVFDETGQLPRLHDAVEGGCRDFTIEEKQERFTGHVTLARVKGLNRAGAEALSHAAAGLKDRRFGEWTAYKIELMQSELLPQGARHTTLADIALTEPAADLA